MSNPVRVCPICTQTDDHPRHVVSLPDGTDLAIHMDCCAVGRNCAVCKAQIAEAGKAKGESLRKHLLSLPPVDLTVED